MKVSRFFLKPVAYLAGRHAARHVRAFVQAHERTREVQEKLLADLLRRHADTAFGRDHGFGAIRTYEDLRASVPIRSYPALRPYVDRVLHGETTALLPPGEPVLMFSRTSGTTGEPKHIPVTGRFLASMRRGWNVFGLRALQDHTEAWLRPILQISSPVRETTSPTGLPCGAISGLLAQNQMRIVRRMYVVPPAVSGICDPLAKYYTTFRCGCGRDVSFIATANPSSTVKMVETAQAYAERLMRDVADGTLTPPGEVASEVTDKLRFRPNAPLAAQMAEGIRRDGRLLPGHVWNVAFLANWTGGTLQLYLPRLRELFGDVPIRDIGLLASEGRFSIPLAADTPAGVAEITGNFLEFIPAADRGQADPAALRAHELEVDQEYFLVLSNWAGLWRYDLGDRIRVVDRFGQSPVFEFLCRGEHTANITGEKITEHQVVEAMRLASARAGGGVERFVVQGRFARTPHYELRLEDEGAADADRLAGLLDEALGELNIEYQGKRKSGRLGAIRPVLLAPGTLQQAEDDNIRARLGRTEQYKHQYLLTEVVSEDDAPRDERRAPGATCERPNHAGLDK